MLWCLLGFRISGNLKTYDKKIILPSPPLPFCPETGQFFESISSIRKV
jgi:hypothetical protein